MIKAFPQWLLMFTLGCLAWSGCGPKGLPVIVVRGTVTCDGEEVETGGVRFVPIEGTKGPASHSTIVNGKYRIEVRGGVPVGKHRVEVDARRKTGKKVPTVTDQSILMEETVPVGPEAYAGRESPLVKEVTANSNGKIDIEIPAR